MTTVAVTSPAGKTEGALTLPAEVFDVQANIPLMHQVVVAQLAAARAGTHSTKTRGEVSGGGKKPFRQKGTGRARQGSIRAPQFAGGGISHGPVPHGYNQRTPKKMKAAALRGALSDRARGGNIHVLSAVLDGDTPSTKTAAAALAALSTGRVVTVVLTRADQAAAKSLRNLPGVHLLPADQLNAYDVLRSDDIVFTKAALDAFLEFAGAPAAVAAAASELPAKPAGGKSATAQKAAAKPATKPAAKKAAAEQPAAEKSADKPATKADADKPATKPAAKKASADADKPAKAAKPAAEPAEAAEQQTEEDSK